MVFLRSSAADGPRHGWRSGLELPRVFLQLGRWSFGERQDDRSLRGSIRRSSLTAPPISLRGSSSWREKEVSPWFASTRGTISITPRVIPTGTKTTSDTCVIATSPSSNTGKPGARMFRRGAVLIDSGQCQGERWCSKACPYDSIVFAGETPDLFHHEEELSTVPEEMVGRNRLVLRSTDVQELMYYTTDEDGSVRDQEEPMVLGLPAQGLFRLISTRWPWINN